MRHRPVAGPIAVAAVLAVGLQPSLAAESTVKVVTMLAKKTPIGQSFDGFIARLNKKLEGEFRMDWRGGPEVVPQFKQPNAVRLGSVDATLTSPSYANGILNVSGAANYSNKTYEEIKATGYHDYMAELHAAKGLIYVGEAPVSHLRFHFFLRDLIATLADFKNGRSGCSRRSRPPSALGASPLVLPMTEIYTAMERGIVKGFVTGVSGVARQYKGLLGAYVEPGFYRATFHFLVNPRAWNKIPAATRAKVIDFVRNVEPPTYEASWNTRLKNGYARSRQDRGQDGPVLRRRREEVRQAGAGGGLGRGAQEGPRGGQAPAVDVDEVARSVP